MKVLVDIGGTKTLIGISDGKELQNLTVIKTPKNIIEFNKLFNKINGYSVYSKILNMAIPGRLDNEGRPILMPNVNIKGFNLIQVFSNNFEKISIQNDVLCGALNLIYNQNVRNSLLINWGSGIGGAIIIDGKIYVGKGNAGEVGHISFGMRDIESHIGGLYLKRNYGYSGEELQVMAEMGNKEAILILKKIGERFGYFLRSMVYIFDPDSIYLIGGVLNSWSFMKESVEKILKTYDRDVNVNVIYDRYYMLRGCYYLDDYLKK